MKPLIIAAAMPLSPGTRLGGRYEVIEPIGAGGMGEIYRARDARLGRAIAVKILPERLADDADALARLEREAQALAALQHPNILTIHDFGREDGVTYVVTELLDGETLRARLASANGPLDWREAIGLAAAVADGLAGAHAHGVVHRDVKPENVFLTKTGGVKVLDFGVARLEGASVPVDEQSRATTLAETAPGTLLGTIGYIAPEILRGLAADARSDLFSLGCVLWEMLFGRRPFAKETVAETVASLLRDDATEPEAHKVPAHVVALALKCLAREPAERPQSAADLAAELRRLAEESTFAVARTAKHAARAASQLAVLPFTNEGIDTDYLADGVTEDLIALFAKMPRLKVVARATVYRYKDHPIDPMDAGRRLGVKSVLTGRLSRKDESTLFVSAELVDVKTGAQKWGDRFTAKQDDLCSLESRIAKEVGDRLLPKKGVKAPRRTPRAAAEAHRLSLKARWHWYRRPQGTPKAIELYEQALEIDPEFAPAWAALADCYISLGGTGVGTLPPSAVMPKAKAAVTRALELDPKLAEAHASFAHVTMHFDWDFAKAEEEIEQALRLDPRSAPSHHWASHLYTILGRTAESETEALAALSLDPLDVSMNVHLAWHYFYARDYDRTIQESNRTLALDPSAFWAWELIAGASAMQGRSSFAIEAHEKALALSPDAPVALSGLGHSYGLAGRVEDAEAVLERLAERARAQYVSPVFVATVEVGLGRHGAALDSLERGYEERSDILPYLAVEPEFEPLANDPRFCDLVERIGLH